MRPFPSRKLQETAEEISQVSALYDETLYLLGGSSMPSDKLRIAVRQLCAIAERSAPGGRSDGELLRDYVFRRNETAFEVLVRRHGPWYWAFADESLVTSTMRKMLF